MALNVLRAGTYDKQAEAETINVERIRSFSPRVSPSRNMWAIGVGWWGGHTGAGIPDVTAAVYNGSLTAPYARLGMVTVISNGTPMLDAGGGARYERALTTIDNAGDYPRSAQRKLPMFAGTQYRLALLAEIAILRYSAKLTNVSTTGQGSTEERGGLTEPPASYSPTTTVSPSQQVPTLYAYGYENEAPEVVINRSPDATVQSLTPTFTGLFRDLNGAYGAGSGNGVDTGDYLSQYQIQVRQVGTTALLWTAVYNATTNESNTDTMTRAYAGSALTRGVAYEWRVRHMDSMNEWGPYTRDGHTEWLAFTVAARGFVTLDSTPTGHLLAITGIDFNGRWTSEQLQSTDRVQIRLLGSDSATVIQTSPEIVKTVAHSASPGTLFTITWAESAFSDLNWGRQYTYSIRGRDTSLEWSNWSTPRPFFINSAPTVPAGLTPANDQVHTSFPKLSASFSDPDNSSGGGLTGIFRITRPDASTVDVTPTYNGTTGKWEFQTTATELSAFGTYSWKAVGYDGTLYSGESTTLAGASWSNAVTFQYLEGPIVTITSPADGATIATANLPVTWTVIGQVKKRIRLYAADTGAVAYDSGEITSTVTSHEIPSGSYRNNASYSLQVSVTDATPLTGSSSVTISISYTPANAPGNIQISTQRFGLDPIETGVVMTWDQTTYPTTGSPRFVEYLVYREADGGPDDGRILLARIENPSVTSFVDYHPASGYSYAYEIVQTIMTGVDTVESAPVGDTVRIDLGQYHILTLAENAGTYRAVLTNVGGKGFGDADDQAVYPSLGGGPPTTIYGAAYHITGDVTAAVIATDQATADAYRDAWLALRRQLGTICYRDGAGTKLFAAIVDQGYDHEMGDVANRWYTLSFSLRQEKLTEGEVS